MSGMAVDPALVKSLNDATIVRYTYFAFIALMIYDHLITFDIEVAKIWSSPWRLPKFLFMVNRYIVPPMLLFTVIASSIPNLPHDFCQFSAHWQAWPTLVSLATIELILVLRASAIYGNRKSVLRLLVVVYGMVFSVWVGIIITLYVSPINEVPPVSFIPGCFAATPGYLYGFWVAPLIFESIVVALTAYKTLVLMYGAPRDNPTLLVLARDSMVYFIVMFGVLLANLILLKVAHSRRGSVMLGPSNAVSSLASTRMMLNLRTLPGTGGGSYELETLKSIAFRSPGNGGHASDGTVVGMGRGENEK